MNKLFFAVSFILLLSTPDAKAFSAYSDHGDKPGCSFSRNPDCLSSFGFSFGVNSLSGDGQIDKATGVQELRVGDRLTSDIVNHDAWEKTGHAVVDLKIPISNSTTIIGDLNYQSHSGDLGGAFDVKGPGINIGFRHYFK